MEKCDKHDETMDRLFNDIHKNSNMLTSIKENMTEIKEFKNMLHGIVFGNGKPGLTEKIGRGAAQLYLQWALLIIIIAAIVGMALKQ